MDFITPEQAAERAGVSRQTIYSAIHRGKLKAETILGRVAVLPADVDACVFSPPNGQRAGVKLGPRKKAG